MLLLNPFKSPYLGEMKNRVVMSAMTRNFADVYHCATESMADYYAKRAEDGVSLILTEGVIVDPTGDGYNNVPHISNDLQAESWKQVVDKVHAAGSKIFCQLWHCGRISHEDFTGGVQPVSSTNSQASGINRQNNKPYGIPRALTTEEIPKIYEMFRQAAHKATKVGFDGIQLHFAHGYLIDQFFDAGINDRQDKYGGSIENRCRFGLELAEIILNDFDSSKVMIRISPSRDMGGIYDWPDLDAMLNYLIPSLDSLGLRMLDISCARADYYQTSGRVIRKVRQIWPHMIIGGASLSPEQAETELELGYLDMVTWGRFILANSDFVTRISQGKDLIPMNTEMLKTLI